jgi:hypothetical protein
MKHVSRYHPLLAALHWVLAVLIIAGLTFGVFVLAATPNSDPQKIGVLRVHMAGGMLILVLMGIRFIARMRTSRPADATTGYPVLDRIAPCRARRWRQPRVGLKNDVEHGPERWWAQLLYPLLKSRRTQSALARQAMIVG